jgi:hypothetical protein
MLSDEGCLLPVDQQGLTEYRAVLIVFSAAEDLLCEGAVCFAVKNKLYGP